MAPSSHRLIGGSTIKRAIECRGSVEASRGEPNISTPSAKHGTAVHHLIEASLREGVVSSHRLGWMVGLNEGEWVPLGESPNDPDGDEYFQIGIDDCEAASNLIDYVRRRLEEKPGGRVLLEESYSLDWLVPEHPGLVGGTADVTIIWDFDELEIIDYKNGRWVVEVIGNTQPRLYGLDPLEKHGWDFENFRATIVQPNTYHEEGSIRSESISIEEMREFAQTVRRVALETQEPNAPFRAGEHCTFCPAAYRCQTLIDFVKESAAASFGAVDEDGNDILVTSDPASFNGDELADAIRAVPTIEAWTRAVKQRERYLLMAGTPVGDRKLVVALGRRKFVKGTTPAEVAGALGMSPHLVLSAPKLLSPAQIENNRPVGVSKREVAKVLAEFITQTEGVRVVDGSDSRPALNPAEAAAASFEAVEEDE